MKFFLVFILLTLTLSATATEFKVLQFEPSKELVAIESASSDINIYKVGQQINFKFENGSTCTFTVTKLVPEKSRMFANTTNCSSANLLVKDHTLRTGVEDSFTLANEAKETKLPTINESWYTYWGLGAAKIKYPSDVQSAFDSLGTLGKVDHTSIALDLFGFYWPLESKQTMMGFVINCVSDSYKVAGVDLTVRQYLYSFSTMTFFGPNIGSEWFLRGDVGFAKYQADVAGNGTSVSSSSKTGYGALLGGGYAWPIGIETRMLLNLNYARRTVEGDSVNTGALTLGFLF